MRVLTAALGAVFLWSMPAGAFTTLATRVAESTVIVTAVRKAGPSLQGAGVAISPRFILTALHVTSDSSLRVKFHNGTTVVAVLVWGSKKLDLAVVDLGITGTARPLRVDCRKPRFMEMVLAIGHGGSNSWTGTAGFVSRARIKAGRFLVDMNVLPGFSGGPVADARGRVLGIVVSAYGVRMPSGLTFIGGFVSAASSAVFCAPLRKAGFLPGKVLAGGPR